jgi:hypothetical protein
LAQTTPLLPFETSQQNLSLKLKDHLASLLAQRLWVLPIEAVIEAWVGLQA